jgi:SpoVK/Ycf46/Vps4 family AAA+-type ATPase
LSSHKNSFASYNDFLLDIGEYFTYLNAALFIETVPLPEVTKYIKRIRTLTGINIVPANALACAVKLRAEAEKKYAKIGIRMKRSARLASTKLMFDFQLSELEMLILLYLSWQEMNTDSILIYIKNINPILKLFSNNEKDIVSRLKLFSNEAKLISNGLIHIQQNKSAPLGAADLIILEPLREMLVGMADYNLATIKQSGKNKDICQTTGAITFIAKEATMEQLHMTEAYLKHYKKIFVDWALGESIQYGSGMVILFYGPPGTGKTLAAKYVAQRCNKELIMLDYPDLLSKYVGDTEKKIKEIFKRAAKTNAVLLIDEADSMMHARSDDSKGWEISQVNVLLQCIEAHDGIVILTTNREELLDKALMRRIILKVAFEMPDAAERTKIWQALLKEQAVEKDVDFQALGKDFAYPGGNIKNAVLLSAILAANKGKGKISMEELREAATIEKKKIAPKRAKIGFGEIK